MLKRLKAEKTALLIIDVQEKLMAAVDQPRPTTENIIRLLHLARLFHLPVIATEQYPKGLGPTLSAVKEAMPLYDPVSKIEFNACDKADFNNRLDSAGVENIILAGIETHICIFQTGLSLLQTGFRVHVPQDAVSSRTAANKKVGLNLLKEAGALISSAETIIYQILQKAGTPEFKEMMPYITGSALPDKL